MKTKLITILFLSITLIASPLMAQHQEGQITNDREGIDSNYEQDSEGNDPVFTHGVRRDLNPLQIQIVQTFGPATPHTFAPGGGLHLGYQLSDLFYIGLTSSAFAGGSNAWDEHRNYRYDDDDDVYDEEVYGQDGADFIESKLDPMHLLELRVMPWDFGLYFSFGAMYRGEQVSTTEFKSEKRTIGDKEYTTGLTAEVEYKEWYGGSAGIGFNYIFNCGLTLGTAINFGLNAQTPDVTVTSTAAVDEEDMEHWKKQIQTNEKQVPYLYTFALGYAF